MEFLGAGCEDLGASEFLTMMGIIIVGLLFFLMAKTFILGEEERVKEYGYRGEAETIVSLIERVSTEPNEFVIYCKDISLCDIIIKDGMLIYKKDDVKYSFQVPTSVKPVSLSEIASICVVKSDGEISLSGERPTCVVDNFCTPQECKEDCPDCYGPAEMCIGDGFCNKKIGENCENSPNDCTCESGRVCCPSSPDADKNGCSNIMNLLRGEECWCSNQCEPGLECNPTSEGFTLYKKACCEPGKGWDGNDCVPLKCRYPCTPDCELPRKWDWRNVDGVNYLNPVRDQHRCGSCWAFSAVGCVEGTYNVESDCPSCNKDLSEQDLVSCSNAGGCNGGWPELALEYIKSPGICDENCFPYQDTNTGTGVKTMVDCYSKCGDWGSRLWRIEDYGFVPSNLDDIKRAVICHGPLSVASRSWMHAVVLVGYDDEKGRWIIRNSWGTGWEDGGYGYIPYSGHSYSGIKNYVLYVRGVNPP